MVVPLVLATLAGLVLLWPTGDRPTPLAADRIDATVEEVAPCPDGAAQGPASCVEATLRLTEGPEEGETITIPAPAGRGAPTVETGDLVVVQRYADVPPESRYQFADFQRGPPMLLLAVVFAAAVIALGRWRGVAALVGLGAAIAVLGIFVLPALVDGHPPLAVAVVGSAAIMIVTLYTAHGLSVRTTVALVGTLVSLTLTGLLGSLFTVLGRFSGLGDEAGAYLATIGEVEVDTQGLLLAGLVIGALGVLDDVTVTQTAAVWEVAAADPSAPRARVFAAGMRVGREHVAATVNTLVLAYAGAALPALVLFSVTGAQWGSVLTTEVVAQELLRGLVGGLGLVAAVPLTTALAALVAVGHGDPAPAQ
jgi:uncharacterized membrane protein